MNIIKKLGNLKPFVASIFIACILTSYNIPLLIVSDSTTKLLDATAILILTALTTLLVYLLSISPLLIRVLTIPLILFSSAFLYFILFYKIKIYPPLMSAIFDTETTEAFELLSVNVILWLAAFGLIPAYLILKLTKNIGHSKRNRIILQCIIVVTVVVLKLNLWNLYKGTIKPIAKDFKTEHPFLHPSYIFNKYLPFSYIYNTKLHLARSINYVTQKKKDLTSQYTFKLANSQNKDAFVVLVVGESARSDRFSLNGYKKNTNPLLSKQKNLVSYRNFYSLDTSTTQAVPHIFIRDLKSKTPEQVKETSVIHIMRYLGFKSSWLSCWRSRQDSLMYDIALEANVTAYGPHIETYNSNENKDALVYDQALLDPLKETIQKDNNGIIVLHTKGSHGNYHERVPKNFHIYQPTCSDNCISNPIAFNNSYDNTIIYTDFFLNEVISLLKDKKAILLYISDHAESLGENGVFAHGAPYATAPYEQTHIPMIWWASDKFLADKENAIKFQTIKANFNKPADQGYIFHSILDCIGVESEAVNKNKSLCRQLAK